jgi:hypothetical protein
MIEILKGLNLALSFILELIAVGAFAYWGFNASDNTLVRIILGVGAPLAMIVVWGSYLAPRSARRLKGPVLSIATLIIFGLAAAALASAGQTTAAAVFVAAAVVNLVLAAVWQQH